MNDLKINVKLDEQSRLDLQLLQQTLSGYSDGDIVKYSLRRAAIDVKLATDSEVERQKQIWRSSGFIGGFTGPEDLSANHKQYIRKIVNEKHSCQERDR